MSSKSRSWWSIGWCRVHLMTLSLSTLRCTLHHVQYCSISFCLRSQNCLISQLATTFYVPVEVKCYIWLYRNEESWHKPVLYELLLIYFIYSHQICQVITGQVESHSYSLTLVNLLTQAWNSISQISMHQVSIYTFYASSVLQLFTQYLNGFYVRSEMA